MPRQRITVAETTTQLRGLIEQYAGTEKENRLKLLKMRREKPGRPLSEIAEQLGISKRTVERWMAIYGKGGLSELLEYKQVGGRRPRRVDDRALTALQQSVESGKVSSVSQAQSWLEEEFGVRYSRSGVWNLLRNGVNALPSGWVVFHDDLNADRSATSTAAAPSATGIPPHILRFLNSLPATGDRMEWIGQFRVALRDLLPGVDRVSIVANFQCDLVTPGSYRPGTVISQRVKESKEGTETNVVVGAGMELEEIRRRILQNFKEQRVPLEQFHEPHGAVYFFGGNAYLGAIFLWRERERTPIPESTLRSFDEMADFFTFALSDLVARFRVEQPTGAMFNRVLAAMKEEAHLSAQEERVVILQLLGHSYKEIAERLYVTIDTVKKHFKQVYRKTKTKGQAELFAKYFTSRLAIELETDGAEDND